MIERLFVAQVSIPNGMEFYRYFRAATGFDGAAFQFPTGWNSTYGVFFFSKRKIVSIPNGMEFYLIIRLKRKQSVCFNSQRDGILLKRF